jgi:hypothetical protein
LRHQVELFRKAFPGRRFGPFFRELEKIIKRKLSYADRDGIIKASLELIESKGRVETVQDYKRLLNWKAEDRKTAVAALENIHSLTEQLANSIASLTHDPTLKDLEEIKSFCDLIYEPLNYYFSEAPVKPVLRRIWHTSKKVIEECAPNGKRGPSRDSELELWLSELAQVYGPKITIGYKDGRRTSPFIEFAKAIFFAVPAPARMGRQDLYTGAALEEHIRRWRARRGTDADSSAERLNRK